MIRYSPLYFFRFILAVFKRQLREKLQNFFFQKCFFPVTNIVLNPLCLHVTPNNVPDLLKFSIFGKVFDSIISGLLLLY